MIGHIPEELASIPVLSVIDLSNNKINGPIPENFGKSFKLMGSSTFVGNSELCGALLRPCLGSVGILGSKGTWRLTRILLLCLGSLVILLGVAFGRGIKSRWKMVSFAEHFMSF
ncbi:hypothetical protein AAHE18_11G026100 [Arachis hypogaea]